MPKSCAGLSKPKEKTTLADPRYDSAAASKSMNNYEKYLVLQEQAAKAALARAPRRERANDRGDLSTLFATIH